MLTCHIIIQITGKWSGETAGGCPNHPATYKNNPMYQIRLDTDLHCLRIELKAPKDVQVWTSFRIHSDFYRNHYWIVSQTYITLYWYHNLLQIGCEIVCVEAKNTQASGYFSKKQSGAYRYNNKNYKLIGIVQTFPLYTYVPKKKCTIISSYIQVTVILIHSDMSDDVGCKNLPFAWTLAFRSGFVVMEIMDMVSGVYNIIPSTFYPKTEAPYFLNFHSSAPVKVNRLK